MRASGDMGGLWWTGVDGAGDRCGLLSCTLSSESDWLPECDPLVACMPCSDPAVCACSACVYRWM